MCSPGKTTPKGEIPGTWGPAIAAANRLGITAKEYLEKKGQGLSWCVDHKDWFFSDFTSMERCAPCNRSRVSAYRLRKKNEKQPIRGEITVEVDS